MELDTLMIYTNSILRITVGLRSNTRINFLTDFVAIALTVSETVFISLEATTVK